jgi:hypothetical protein
LLLGQLDTGIIATRSVDSVYVKIVNTMYECA